MRKKILPIILVITLLLTSLSFQSFADVLPVLSDLKVNITSGDALTLTQYNSTTTGFKPQITSYFTTVNNDVASVDITPSVTEAVYGVAVTSETDNQISVTGAVYRANLKDGLNVFDITVSDSAGAGNTYHLTVTRQYDRTESNEIAESIAAEGIVLLENKDNALPLAQNKKVSVFGTGQVAEYLGGGGSGSISAKNPVYLLDAMRAEGIQINEDLTAIYKNWYNTTGKNLDYRPVEGGGGAMGEYSTSAVARAEMPLTDDQMAQAKAFSDTAIIVIARSGSEGLDLGKSDLKLYPGEETLIEKVTGNFTNVIVLFNIQNALEMGFLEEYPSIKAAAVIWAPGEVGMTSVGKMLTGEVNPSGKLADTIAYHIEDHPSTANFGSYVLSTSDYANNKADYYLEYKEGIYVGYRYFETMAPEKVQYEFGYGKSYTTFNVSLQSYKVNKSANRYGSITVDALVKNTGSVAGKEVVQVYYGAPDGKLEKPAKELVGFGKTKLLKPGESQIVSITFDIEEMASWSDADGCYLLEKGNYSIYMGTSVKQIVSTSIYNLSSDIKVTTDPVTKTEYSNLFDDMDSYYENKGISLLSKKNPTDTWPASAATVAGVAIQPGMTAGGLAAVGTGNTGGTFVTNQPTVVNNTITLGQNESKAAIQLKDVYEGSASMDLFVNQFTDTELVNLHARGGFMTIGIERLGIPATNQQDGPACVKAMRNASRLNGQINGVAFPIGTMVACTWNEELAEAMGEAAAKEAKLLNVDAWYAPGGNTHRSPMGGRNFEYFSEDPMLGGIIMARMVKAAQAGGLTTTVKHFVGNDQETNRFNVHQYMPERAFREIYLKQFEMSFKAGSMGTMSAFNALGPTWAGGSKALLTDLLRGEWGYKGYVLTDMYIGGYMDPVKAAYAGNDTMLASSATRINQLLADFSAEFSQRPEQIRAALRENAEHTLNYVMQTHPFSKIIGNTTNIGSSVTDYAFPFTATTAAYVPSTGGSGSGSGSGSGTKTTTTPVTPTIPVTPTTPDEPAVPSAASKIFNDVSSGYSWAADAIDQLAEKGIIKGTSASTFAPGSNIKRADFMLLLVRTLELKAEIDSGFSDVSEKDYYYEALGIAKKLGIAAGFEDGKFNPEGEISRQDMMVLAARALKASGKLDIPSNTDDLSGFADASQISDYAKDSVAALVKAGLVKGSGNAINPKGTATRAEIAVLVYRMIEK